MFLPRPLPFSRHSDLSHTLSLSPATVLINGPDGRPRTWCQRGPLGQGGCVQGSGRIRRPLEVLWYKYTHTSLTEPGRECSVETYARTCAFSQQLLDCEPLLSRNAVSLARLHFCSARQGGGGRGRSHEGQTVPLGPVIAAKHARVLSALRNV